MKRFVEGEDRSQSTLFPERLDDNLRLRLPQPHSVEPPLGTRRSWPVSQPARVFLEQFAWRP